MTDLNKSGNSDIQFTDRRHVEVLDKKLIESSVLLRLVESSIPRNPNRGPSQVLHDRRRIGRRVGAVRHERNADTEQQETGKQHNMESVGHWHAAANLFLKFPPHCRIDGGMTQRNLRDRWQR